MLVKTLGHIAFAPTTTWWYSLTRKKYPCVLTNYQNTPKLSLSLCLSLWSELKISTQARKKRKKMAEGDGLLSSSIPDNTVILSLSLSVFFLFFSLCLYMCACACIYIHTYIHIFSCLFFAFRIRNMFMFLFIVDREK